jgi:hypothetical protein
LELYGTYLAHLILKELQKSPCSIKALAGKISPGQSGRELRNLKQRIRNSLNRMIEEGRVTAVWKMDHFAYKQYALYELEDASQTE